MLHPSSHHTQWTQGAATKTTSSITDTNLDGFISTYLGVLIEELECGEQRERGLVTTQVRSCAEQG